MPDNACIDCGDNECPHYCADCGSPLCVDCYSTGHPSVCDRCAYITEYPEDEWDDA